MASKNMTEKTQRTSIIFLVIFSVVFSVLFILLPNRIYLGIKKISFQDNFNFSENSANKKYTGPAINAESYLIYDNSNKKIILEKNNRPKPLASVTKLMTALVALENCQDNLIFDGVSISKQKAVEKMLIESSNEVAEAIADICPNRFDFVVSMNTKAQSLGLQMTFANPSGLDENNETESSAFGSPSDIAKLIDYLYTKYPSILETTSYSSISGFKNTNTFASSWPFLLASKTGYTDTAHGNLAILFEPVPNKKISIVVLGSTKEERFQDVYNLLNWYLKEY